MIIGSALTMLSRPVGCGTPQNNQRPDRRTKVDKVREKVELKWRKVEEARANARKVDIALNDVSWGWIITKLRAAPRRCAGLLRDDGLDRISAAYGTGVWLSEVTGSFILSSLIVGGFFAVLSAVIYCSTYGRAWSASATRSKRSTRGTPPPPCAKEGDTSWLKNKFFTVL